MNKVDDNIPYEGGWGPFSFIITLIGIPLLQSKVFHSNGVRKAAYHAGGSGSNPGEVNCFEGFFFISLFLRLTF